MKCTICNKSMNGLTCSNKHCGEIHVECSTCNKVLNQSDAYDYRGFIFCEEHFDEGQNRVEHRRNEVMQVSKESVESQRDGEWYRGGYKNMKVDAGGRPITKIKEPLSLKDYEDRKL